jgi:hypothetical protein
MSQAHKLRDNGFFFGGGNGAARVCASVWCVVCSRARVCLCSRTNQSMSVCVKGRAGASKRLLSGQKAGQPGQDKPMPGSDRLVVVEVRDAAYAHGDGSDGWLDGGMESGCRGKRPGAT